MGSFSAIANFCILFFLFGVPSESPEKLAYTLAQQECYSCEGSADHLHEEQARSRIDVGIRRACGCDQNGHQPECYAQDTEALSQEKAHKNRNLPRQLNGREFWTEDYAVRLEGSATNGINDCVLKRRPGKAWGWTRPCLLRRRASARSGPAGGSSGRCTSSR
jgi:hypothetical protein